MSKRIAKGSRVHRENFGRLYLLTSKDVLYKWGKIRRPRKGRSKRTTYTRDGKELRLNSSETQAKVIIQLAINLAREL
jgi:hypothetical protein